MQKTDSGKVIVYSVETGEPCERWPVDARGMVECGEYSYSLPSAEGDDPEGADTDPANGEGGYRVEEVGGGWFRAFGPDGEELGKAARSAEEAWQLVPLTHRPAEVRNVGVGPVEHSPGVPLATTTEAGPGKPAV